MAEEKGLLASAIETVKMMSLNGNGVHDEEASSASDTPGSENANGQESKTEAADEQGKVATESTESPQIHRVVRRYRLAIKAYALSEFILYPLQ